MRTVAVALAAAAAVARAGPAPRPWSVQARAARTEVRLGEPFAYEIEIRHAPGEAYAMPAALALEPFEAEAPRCVREAAGDGVTTTCAMRLALFELGPHDVPAIPLAVRTDAGDARLAVAGPRITGVGVVDPAAAPESLALRDPAPPVPLLVPTWRPLVVAAAAVGAIALALLAVRAVRRARRRRGPERTEADPPVPAELRLLRRLDALEAAPGDARAFAFALSEALRAYVGALVSVPALELTTPELVERLARAADPRLDVEEVRAALERLDVVKFAGGTLSAGDRAGALRWARRLGGATATATAMPTTTGQRGPPSPPAQRSEAGGEGRGEGGR